jgi:hypothetical protein
MQLNFQRMLTTSTSGISTEHLAFVNLGMTAMLAVAQLARQLGDYRNRTLANILFAICAIVFLIWVHLVALWFFHIDLISWFQNPITIAIVAFCAIVTATVVITKTRWSNILHTKDHRVAGYSTSLTFHGPSDIDLIVFQDGAGCLCKFKNGSPSPIKHFQIRFLSAQSLDFANSKWRDAKEPIGAITSDRGWIEAGAYSSDLQFMTTDYDGSIRLGGNPSQQFPWPNADPSTIRRWRLKFSISGSFPGKTGWNADICLRWTPGSPVEIREWSDSTPVADL